MQRDEQKLRAYFADAPEDISLEQVDLERIPRHVSIIMDGNGTLQRQSHAYYGI